MAMTRASFFFVFFSEVEKRIHWKEKQSFVARSTVQSVCLAFLGVVKLCFLFDFGFFCLFF